jgi:hypothetical protein
MYGNGYSKFMDYSATNALLNPGYGAATGIPAGGPGNQDTNVDLLVQRMTDVLPNQFGLKPKNQGHMYTPPFPEWYHRVALPNMVKVPTEFTKFSRQDDTSTVEHIARYLMQLGEASADEAFKIRYFPLSLTDPAFTWFTSLPAHSICSWKDLEQKFHAHYYTSSNEKKLIDLTTFRQSVNTKNWYRKETDLWAEFGKKTPFGRKFSSKHSVKMPAVGSTPSFGRRDVLRSDDETFRNT